LYFRKITGSIEDWTGEGEVGSWEIVFMEVILVAHLKDEEFLIGHESGNRKKGRDRSDYMRGTEPGY
jgi:hypothetical protein